jgi:hypothetical protein
MIKKQDSNDLVTDIAWLTRRLQGTRIALNIKAEDVDEFEEDIVEMLDETLSLLRNSLVGARRKAFDNLLVRLENKAQS